MSYWLIGGLVYWAGCFLFLIASMALCNEHDQRWELLKAVARRKPWLVIACVSISLLFIAAIAPVATPYWLVRCTLQARRDRAYWNHLTRTHREFIFDPIHPVNLPNQTRAYFESGAEELKLLGFTPLGIYRMKEDPADYFGRCFLGGDGAVVCTLIDIFGEQNYGFSTIFEGGRMLETTSSECTEATQWLREHQRYRAVYATEEPIEAGWRKHAEAVAAAVEREGARPLAFETDAVLDFIQYEGRLFSQILFERGELIEPPPEPEIPRHRASHAGNTHDAADSPDLRTDGIASELELAVR